MINLLKPGGGDRVAEWCRIFILGLLMSAHGITAIPAQAEEGENRSAPKVTVGTVKIQPNIQSHVTIGTARAWQTVALTPDAEGRIEKLYVGSGQKVGKGERLLKLDSASEELAVAQAKVDLQSATRIFRRSKQLDKKGAVPVTTLETAEINLQTARIKLKEAELALSRRSVKAPFDGWLGIINLHPGAHVTPSTEVVRLDNRSILLLDFKMPEEAVTSISVGSDVAISSPGNRQTSQARVETIAHHVDPQTRTVTVRARIDHPLPQMMPGMSFKVSVATENGSHPVIPEVAILWGSRGAYLWAVREGAAKRLPITVVRRRDGMVWVQADLSEGDVVVVEGVQKVREGDPINVPRHLTPMQGKLEVSANE